MAGTGLAVWSVPTVLGAAVARATTALMLQIDPTTCLSVASTDPTLVPGCAPAGWESGEPAVANAGIHEWTISARGNAVDCSNGFQLDLNSATCTIEEGLAEETCPFASPPSNNCVTGVISPDRTSIVFPTNLGPTGCFYIAFRIVLFCPGSF